MPPEGPGGAGPNPATGRETPEERREAPPEAPDAPEAPEANRNALAAPTVVPLWPADPNVGALDEDGPPSVVPVVPGPDVTPDEPERAPHAAPAGPPSAAAPPAAAGRPTGPPEPDDRAPAGQHEPDYHEPAGQDGSGEPPAPEAAPVPAPVAERLGELDRTVSRAVDQLAGLAEADLPESVERLRAALDELGQELQAVLRDATDTMTEERRQLRSQIAATVGAANRWFVRTRDQLYERLDHIAELASQAEAQAGVAATAATEAAATAAATPAPAPAAEVDDDGFEWDVEEPGYAPSGVAGPGAGEAAAGVATAHVELAVEAPELEALMAPVRVDVQELQVEISAMGEVVTQLAGEVGRLRQRMPARSRTVRIDPDQVDEIVEAVATRLSGRRTSQAGADAAPRRPASGARKAGPRATKR